MIQTLKTLSFKSLSFLYAFGLAMLVFQYSQSYVPSTQTAEAQISAYTATTIGGQTNGVTDLCCNGVVLDFDSINPLNPFILNGEALFVPLLSGSYSNGNEFSSGYNTLGTVVPGICLTVESECYTPEYKLTIRKIGTSFSNI